MRKLKVVVQMSVDGFGADNKGKTDWLVWNWSPDWTWNKPLQKVHEKVIASAGTVLQSRNMINGEYLSHWSEIASHPGNQQRFARNLIKMKNYAFSRRLKSGQRENAEVINADLKTAVNKLKRRTGKDMPAFGGVFDQG